MYRGQSREIPDGNIRGGSHQNYLPTKRASEDPIINKTKKRKMSKTKTVATATCEIATPAVENMKTKKGTAKPSGAGVGKGGSATSPTDGGSLKVKGGKKKK